jgi:phosphoglycerate dehydrogenase-like enzyme
MNRIAISDRIKCPDIEFEVLGETVAIEPSVDTEVLLVWHATVDRSYIDRFPKLRYIIRYCVGYDRVDLEYASSKGIVVSNTPDYCTDEVADSALAMILGISRKVFLYDAHCRTYENGWQENVFPSTKRVSETTVGVIGAGRIGQGVLMRAKAIGYKTVFFDPYLPCGFEKVFKSSRTDDLKTLLKESDIVTIHTPLTAETRGLVNEEFIDAMKDGASLVNNARGGIVENLEVFYEPLKSGKLDTVALDVLPSEPPPAKGRLLEAWRSRAPWLDGRFIVNPHAAFHSAEASIEMRRKVAQNAKRFLEGKVPLNIVFP